MSTAVVRSAFVGRDRELSTLTGIFERVRGGAPGTVLLGGDIGAGKSRLVTWFVDGLTGALPLIGACQHVDGDGLPGVSLRAVLRGWARRHAEFVEPSGAAATGDRAVEPFERALATLDELTGQQPVVAVIEDLHWADRAVLGLLNAAIRDQRAGQPLLVVGTYRSDHLTDNHPLRPLLAELARLPWVNSLHLGGLSKTAVAAQLRDILGTEPTNPLVENVFRRSDGIPLFVEALARAQPSGVGLPNLVRDLRSPALARLAEQTQAVVRAVSVGGDRVDHRLLAAVTGLDDEALSAALRPAVASNLLATDDSGYVFRRHLDREVIEADLLPGERDLLHIRYAERLECDPSLVPPGRAAIELARHWYAVSQRQPIRALTASWRAAVHAEHAREHAERLSMLTQILDLWGRVPDAGEQVAIDSYTVYEQAVDAAIAAGEEEHALALIDAALNDPALNDAALNDAGSGADSARAARLLRRRGEARFALGLPGDLADLRAAARLAPTEHPARPAILNALAGRLLSVPFDVEGSAVAIEAVRAAQAFGDRESAAYASMHLAYASARTGDLDQYLPDVRSAREQAEQAGDLAAIMYAWRCEADLLQDHGCHETAATAARRGLRVAADAGLYRSHGPAHAGNLAEALYSLGRWDEAEENVTHALELNPAPSLRAYLMVVAGSIAVARGDLVRAEAAAAYARQVFTSGTAYAQDLLQLVRLEVELHLACHRRSAAVDLVQRTLAAEATLSSPRYAWPLLTLGAFAAPDAVAQLRAATELPVIGPVQRAHQYTFAAELDTSRGPSAAAAWDHAASAWAALGQPYPWAGALIRAAELDIEAGDRNGAAERLRTAAEQASLLAATPLRAQIDRLARLCRIDLRRAAPDDQRTNRNDWSGLGLTPREVEVLSLIRDGHTNRQIAEALFISIKTASVHVSNILAKLGVASRVQAATVAARLP